MTPWLLIAGAIAPPIALYLSRHPLGTLFMCVPLLLLPMALRVEPLYTLATDGAIVTALATWLATPGPRCRWSATTVLLALLIAWSALTAVWAPDAVESRREVIAWLIGFAFLFLIIDRTSTVAAADAFMLSLNLTGWTLICASLYTVTLGGYDFVHRLRVLDMNENTLGLLLILLLPGILWPVLRSGGRRRTALLALSIVYILCTLAFIALSGSRGSVISLVLILFTFLFSRSTRPWGIVGFVLVGGILLVAPFLLDVIMRRFSEEEGGEMGGRAELWEASLRFILERPFTGAGVGNGPVALHDHIAAVTSVYNRRRDLPSHQPILEVGVDTGLVGIGLYVAAVLAALWSFARSIRAWNGVPDAPAGYHMIAAGTAVGYLSSWFKGGGLKNHPSFFLLLALLLLPSHLARAHRSRVRAAPRPAGEPRPCGWTAGGASV